MGKLAMLGAALTVAAAILFYRFVNYEAPIPELHKTWWRRGTKPNTVDEKIHPFSIPSAPELMDDIKSRLVNATERLVAPLEDAGFTYGFNTNYLREVLRHWRTKYDWTARLKRLNAYQHYRTNIEGLNIHFLQAKPQLSSEASQYRVIPLLMLHGWPGSVVEFYNVLPMLTRPRPAERLVFHVVCPSLPGYGFSDGAQVAGLSALETASIMRQLMVRLGFGNFYVHGGDWGSIIATNMGLLFPDNVNGIHITMPVSGTRWSGIAWMAGSLMPSLVGSEWFQRHLYPMSTKLTGLVEESGYLHLQATRPDSLGVALSDSPAGLAAYILEKFSVWTDREQLSQPDGGLTRKLKLDELLDNVMIYWISNSITTSMRLYAETFSARVGALQLAQIPCRVPTGLLYAPNEVYAEPPLFLWGRYTDIISTRELDNGGHFLALERPGDLTEHVFTTISAIIERNQQQNRDKTTDVNQ